MTFLKDFCVGGRLFLFICFLFFILDFVLLLTMYMFAFCIIFFTFCSMVDVVVVDNT